MDPRIHFGQPCVLGTRVPVSAVLELIRSGIAFDRIVGEFYPELTVEDLEACVQYAIDLIRSEEVHVSAGA